MLSKGEQSPRVKKEWKPALRGKWESVFSGRHMDNVPKETHVVSVMTSLLLETEGMVRGEKDDRLLLHPIRSQNRLTARDKNPHRNQAIDRKTQWIRVNFHSDSNSVNIRHEKLWHPPVCLNYSLKKDVYIATNAISDMLSQRESPPRSRRKVVRRISWYIERVCTIAGKEGSIVRDHPKVCAS